MSKNILKYDPLLEPYASAIAERAALYRRKKKELTAASGGTLSDFASGYAYFGFHKQNGGWVYREWAPAAEAVYLSGDMNGWNKTSLPLTPLGNGVFELFLEGENALWNGCHVKAVIRHEGELLERVPLYILRAEQDPMTHLYCGVIVDEGSFPWQNTDFTPAKPLYIYECHIGMAQEKEGIGSFREFKETVLPRVKAAGYNALQIMAVMEHPYYASFGYQVSSFFAVSSRFGQPKELKELIDAAHGMGIAVLLDVVHSHAARNVEDGLGAFDGTPYQFFHQGERGEHPTWGTKLFDYGKNQVIHFLLSNLKFWLEEYRFDGFRFDGVTSMLYRDHGLGVCFDGYGKYFSENTDADAVVYLMLAATLAKEVSPASVLIAEDMSAMPGMCLPIKDGGMGFDYRLGMGLPDLWIKLTETRDEDWDLFHIWHELSCRRSHEKYIAYAESHDQALVGDKTLMFRLCDSKMYTNMAKNTPDAAIDRGMALHKIIRFLTFSAGGEGYLNFMGNEFGHPEWIDFPREGNGNSFFYCRRQWHLADDPALKYGELLAFDRQMLALEKKYAFLSKKEQLLLIDPYAKVLTYRRAALVFAVNLHPSRSYERYEVTVPTDGKYKVVFSSDDKECGGWDRISREYVYRAHRACDGRFAVTLYLPSRCALCLAHV